MAQSKDKDSDDIELEDELDDEDSDDTKDSPFSINYSFDEERILAEQFYKSAAIDYMKLFYGDTGKRPPVFAADNGFYSSAGVSDTTAETLSTEEAEKTFINVQYATVMGRAHDVSFEQLKKFDLWIKFNQALFHTFELSYGVTRDTNYRPLM